MNIMTNGATVEIVATGEQYHSIKNWGLAIGNNDYIGDVEQETYYVDVPGADGFLDFSEAITGRRIFKSRPINIEFGGKKPRNDWDIFISDLRNLLEGREIKIIFDNDPEHYWTGRATIKNFDRNRELGTFTLSMPKADPYKYAITDSTENWLWDTFNFETGIIDEGAEITIEAPSSMQSYTITKGGMPFVPVILVSQMGETGITMKVGTETYTLLKGKNRFGDLVVDQKDVTLTFTGQGTVTIQYRRRSL